MKTTTNLNDVRRMRLLFNAGASVGEVSARLHIQPSVVARWEEKFTAPAAEADPAPPGDLTLEQPKTRGRRKIT